jgi:hypothetical protein
MDIESLGPLCDLTEYTPAQTAQCFVKLCTQFAVGANAHCSFARSRSCTLYSPKYVIDRRVHWQIIYDFLLRSEADLTGSTLLQICIRYGVVHPRVREYPTVSRCSKFSLLLSWMSSVPSSVPTMDWRSFLNECSLSVASKPEHDPLLLARSWPHVSGSWCSFLSDLFLT